MAIEERWVGVDDVAAHLGVSKDSVYRWIEARDLPARRVGRLLRFKLSEIDDWVRRGDEDDNKMGRTEMRGTNG
jgi:excisionase family DNA binding protein